MKAWRGLILTESVTVHISSAWHTGSIPKALREPGKVPPPVINTEVGDDKLVTTTLRFDFIQLIGLPSIHSNKGGMLLHY